MTEIKSKSASPSSPVPTIADVLPKLFGPTALSIVPDVKTNPLSKPRSVPSPKNVP